MIKAMKAIQRSYLRAPYKAFMVSQKQHSNLQPISTVPNRVVSMTHTTKAGPTK
jgi:hypothetical protein